MDKFRNKKLPGEFWIHDQPGHVFSGQLTIDEENDGKLDLSGTEAQLANLPVDGTVQLTFFGRLTAHYSYEVTLFDTVLTRGPGRTLNSSGTEETHAEYVTNAILVGEQISSQDDQVFDGANLRLTGLEAWCDTTGFSGGFNRPTRSGAAGGRISVSLKETATRNYKLDSGRTLRFLSNYEGPTSISKAKKLHLEEKNTLELLFSEHMSIRQIQQEIHIWQSFLTFALRRPSYGDEVFLLRRSKHGYDRTELIFPGRKTDSRQPSRREESLFRQSTLGAALEKRLRGWRTKHDDIQLAVLIFCGVAYQESVYIHTSLLSYLQALEVLHRESLETDHFPDDKTRKDTLRALRAAVPSTLDPALQDQLKEGLAFLGSVTLLDRLKHLYSLYPKSLRPLFPRGDLDMSLLKDIRNFLTHYGEHKIGKDFLWSRDVFILKEKVRLFAEICLLGAMGMTDDDIHDLMEQFDSYRHWRIEVSLERFRSALARRES